MPELDTPKSFGKDRDERGRLKLPSTTYIPFQRVQKRPNRSITSSRQESPEHERKADRSHTKRSTNLHRTSRSHSFNVSELGNSHDDDSEGYHFDGDQDSNGRQHRRSRSKHQDTEGEEVTKKLHHLSLAQERKSRRRSFSNEQENTKMPYIPFQRVLHIRTRPVVREAEDSFKVPMFTALRDRRDFRLRYDSQLRTDGFTTEYKSRFRERKKGMKGRKKAQKWKNDSQINELLAEKDMMNGQSELDSDEEEKSHASDEENDDQSRQSPSESQHLVDSLRTDNRSGSSTSSVKLPQIQPSQVSITDSAKSVKSSGASPFSQAKNLKPPESNSYAQNHLLLAKVQPVETSKWVEGKGAGCLKANFPQMNCSKNAKEVQEKSGSTIQLPTAGINKKGIPFVQSVVRDMNHPSKAIERSRSDSDLYYQKKSKANKIKPHANITFKEDVTRKTINIRHRPETSLPSIILTTPEEQNSNYTEIVENSQISTDINIQQTPIPQYLPQINLRKGAPTKKEVQQKTKMAHKKTNERQQQIKSYKTSSVLLKAQQPFKAKHRYRPSKTSNLPNSNKMQQNYISKASSPIRDLQLLHPNSPREQAASPKFSTYSKPLKSFSNGSLKNKLQKHNQPPVYKLQHQLHDKMMAKQHVENIKKRRKKRLQNFAHLLGEQYTGDQNNMKTTEESEFAATSKEINLIEATT
ncbi:hypothetical protein SK128_011061 [Halocaridina rubra]|uniref:Uncharacterized protein n=1 Tax=Halocaridina rubra TaxID=373956 RepID=A0AAN8WVA0_HALRR